MGMGTSTVHTKEPTMNARRSLVADTIELQMHQVRSLRS